MHYEKNCRWFTGYKPCKFKRSCLDCPHVDKISKRILIVSLDAMGAVLRSTCLLKPIKKKYPDAHITWVTLGRARPLLHNNPLIDRILDLDAKSLSILAHLKFDILYSVDKSIEAGALSETINADEKWGFGLNSHGVIVPYNKFADYQYDLGLNDELKFFKNQKAETQQITETMGLKWERDEYLLELTEEEKAEVRKRRENILTKSSDASIAEGIIGYNTGCSPLFPYKKLPIDKAIETIAMWRKQFPNHVVELLGGPEDSSRQKAMKEAFLNDPFVFNSPTTEGLRSGILWIGTADLVFTGCSLGMHISIALKKPVIAWFGLSCIQEIDVYDRGEKISADVNCSPCWKKSCDQEIKCFNMVDINKISKASSKILGA